MAATLARTTDNSRHPPPPATEPFLAAAGFMELTALRADSFGAVASSASNARVFVSGPHLSGLVAVALFLVVGLSTVLMRSN
jgi:hypothetical protein